MLELRRLEQFAKASPDAAEEAFALISPGIERFLFRFLGSYLPNEEDRQDVISVVLHRLWLSRERLEVRGLGAWWAFVAVTARRCALDHAGSWRDGDSLEEELPEGDVRLVEVIAEHASDRKRLYRAADELWLGAHVGGDDLERSRQVLAAQLFYLHSRPWPEVAEIVGLGRPVSRSVLDDWLAQPEVLHDLAFSRLYFPCDEMARLVLRPDSPLTKAELAAWDEGAERGCGPAPDPWTWGEIRVVILRYRNGLPETKICQMTGLSAQAVDGILEKARRNIPSSSRAAQIASALLKHRVKANPLASAGVWKRVVFQYHAADELPQKQILEIVEPAAEVGSYSISAGILNMWLSGGRLLRQLAEYVHRQEALQ